MKVFKCQNCGQVLYFENTHCESCSSVLGYLPVENLLTALVPSESNWAALAVPGQAYRFCENHSADLCNWLVPAASEQRFCLACRHNHTVPNLDVPENLSAWRVLERGKHRLIYSLLQLRLPLLNRIDDPAGGLAFDFLADPPVPEGHRVLTGHDDGLITLALAEADDAEREKRRHALHEPYRTVLGHFRHEVGHYYWDRLVRSSAALTEFRELFGDDRQDYATSLQQHYADGAEPGWQDRFISAYASSHPWEDFAESWAHYLHLVDTLEMAIAFGLRAQPKIEKIPGLTLDAVADPYQVSDIAHLIDAWLPLTFAVNCLNRCMGTPDLYPFILSPAVIEKLGFIHRLIHAETAAR